MTQIKNNFYQFTEYVPLMDFTIHQYLLTEETPILFAAGTVQQAEHIMPQIKEILGDKKLCYIFVSHMESDECGGISVFQEEYPDVKVICSALCARELPGFGYRGTLIPQKGGGFLEDKNLALQFFDYPSEVHLQNGIICYERNRGIFYSADLMLSFGNAGGMSKTCHWVDVVNQIDNERIPNTDKAKHLKKELLTISPRFIAVGHGFCLECE